MERGRLVEFAVSNRSFGSIEELVRLKSLPLAERPKFLERSQSSKFEEVVSGEGIVLLKRAIGAKARD